MLNYLIGQIKSKHPAEIIIEVNGFGFEVYIPLSTFNKLGVVGEQVKIFTSLYIRQENWAIYGFATEEERSLFNLLTTVSGVGPKSAIAALSAMSTDQIITAIATGDVEKLTLIPGIGKKTAQRLILELKDKVKILEVGEIIPLEAEPREAVLALEALGFNRHQAEKAVERALKAGGEGKAEEIIRKALGFMTKSL
jgi:Holliday junction DNA helicase RuvA